MRYGIIICSVWDKPEFLKLPPIGKLALVYLWSFQKRNSAGIYRENLRSIEILAQKAFGPGEFETGFRLSEEAGFLFEDPENSVILINQSVKWSFPSNANMIRGWKGILASIPNDSHLKDLWMEQTRKAIKERDEITGNKFLETFDEYFKNGTSVDSEELDPEEYEALFGEPKAKENPRKPRRYNNTPDEEFLKGLFLNPAFRGMDIQNELNRMDVWLQANPGRQKTRKFIVGWLLRQKPVITRNQQGQIPKLSPIGQKNMAAAESLIEEHRKKYG